MVIRSTAVLSVPPGVCDGKVVCVFIDPLPPPADVNFASELSDLRHRHGFQVILVHGTHTSPALLQHAHRQVPFLEITADLPLRVPLKSQVGPPSVKLNI